MEAASPPRWVQLSHETRLVGKRVAELTGLRSVSQGNLFVARGGIETSIPSGELAIRAFGDLYLLPGSRIASFARTQIESATEEPSNEKSMVVTMILEVISHFFSATRGPTSADALLNIMCSRERAMAPWVVGRLEDSFDFLSFSNIILETDWKCFNTSAWERRGKDEDS